MNNAKPGMLSGLATGKAAVLKKHQGYTVGNSVGRATRTGHRTSLSLHGRRGRGARKMKNKNKKRGISAFLACVLHKRIAAAARGTRRVEVVAAIVLLTILTITGAASAEPGWRYNTSHGLSHCAFAAFGPGGAVINTSTTASTPGGLTISGEAGSTVTLRLICERAQTFDRQGQLASVGPEGTYSGPGGAGVVMGTDKPSERTTGYPHPKGREWTVAVADGPATHTLSWAGQTGQDSLSVTIQPFAPPPSAAAVQQWIEPAQQRADEAYTLAESGGRGWRNRVFAFQAQYTLGLDSLNNDGDARQGWGLDANVFLGSDSNVRFLTGVTFGHDFRQKPVMSAPNQPMNGYNAFVDWQTFFVGPKAGVEVMPTSWFQFQAWGSLGALVSVDGTIPVSQLPDKTLYTGESNTTTALGYRFAVQPGFVISEHFVFGANLGLLGNLSKLPEARGPKQVCNTQTEECLVRQDGYFTDLQLGAFGAVMF